MGLFYEGKSCYFGVCALYSCNLSQHWDPSSSLDWFIMHALYLINYAWLLSKGTQSMVHVDCAVGGRKIQKGTRTKKKSFKCHFPFHTYRASVKEFLTLCKEFSEAWKRYFFLQNYLKKFFHYFTKEMSYQEKHGPFWDFAFRCLSVFGHDGSFWFLFFIRPAQVLSLNVNGHTTLFHSHTILQDDFVRGLWLKI